ncbi:sulfite exporter TauE/SafE family protein 3 isoform X3 [Manihot esculenta]|uniref:sulfite exporter TauE/SafE family protein 3 isoform X3 n=1 Tax=Manihot esculenta TaxID=3983 RepID=UPI001CC66F30|nr:sulfite exporter TauE/SafE family protein 3 isoform X3 [Manihot esculenta]
MEASKEQESTGLLHKILPPRLEDAGLEDCALPPESIKEAFLKAASAVKAGATSFFSGDEEDDCVQDPWPEAIDLSDEVIGGLPGSAMPDTLVGVEPEKDVPGQCVTEKGDGLVWEGGDKVVVGGGDVEEKEREKGCVDDGFKGLKIADKEENGGATGGNGDEEQEEKEGMITGAAAATVYYNLKLRHPTLELPIIDYDLALLFQPMLVLGISLGVALNVIFADWTITILLIILFIENTTEEVEDKTPPGGPISAVQAEASQSKEKVSIVKNVRWKELGLLVAVWLIILGLQIGKNYLTTCSATYWVLNILQIPVAVGVTAYEAVGLYKGQRKIASMGDVSTNWQVRQLVLYCVIGVFAGIVGGMLGLGGGFILGPLFLEMGVPPQVSSATATFAMTFSASMSVIEYYLLKRFPVPYALYFFAVAVIAAFVGQHVVRKLISILGRASLIIFILAFTIFVSALLLGGVGIAHMIKKIEKKEYMGFENICSYGD